MLVKYEAKCVRVKGLSFHPSRSWLLTSLSSGSIQLWDYQKQVLIEKYEEHEGPVRCVQFHMNQPLFVSGGDDMKIKVWNYKQKRCIFTLLDHQDYIRTCFFHHESPWILSASDDGTVRIWNWQARSCISVLSGHTHYVMCAQFHPSSDLIASGSLDNTIRVWDMTALIRKSVLPSGRMELGRRPKPELFSSRDPTIKFILEGHERGVNWVAFHLSQPLIASASDDRTVRLWRYDDYRAIELGVYRGHFNNVSCVVFHPIRDLIISNSEDKHIRVWDLPSRVCVKLYRTENDRFWILSVHKGSNLLAAGHESGMLVFKLQRERTPFSVHQNNIYYVNDRVLRVFNIEETKDTPIMSLKRPAGVTFDSVLDIHYNPAENALLLTSRIEDGSYELYTLPKKSEPTSAYRALGRSAVWVARNKFAVLTENKTILIVDLKNEITKKIDVSVMAITSLSYAGIGTLLLITDNEVFLFDVQQKQTLAECSLSGVRRVVWSSDSSHVAMLTKFSIVISSKKLEQLCTVQETTRVKSATWDSAGVLLYTTACHIKYLLLNGDSGIIRTLDIPIYITAVRDDKVYCFDNESRPRVLEIDPSEYKFKFALVTKNYDEVLYMVRTSNLIGQSIIFYLQQKGYPELALHFVKDEKAKFPLALQCNNLQVALNCAKKLNDPNCWELLAECALKQGNCSIVELAYQQTKNFERLLLFYIFTGNIAKLPQLKKQATYTRGASFLYTLNLFLGDYKGCVQVLEENNQHALAYLMATTYGLEDDSDRIKQRLLVPPGFECPSDAQLLLPPTPANPSSSQEDWPLLSKTKTIFDMIDPNDSKITLNSDKNTIFAEEEIGIGWGEKDLELDTKKPSDHDVNIDATDNEEYKGWDVADDIDVPGDLDIGIDIMLADKTFILPATGPTSFELWSQNSVLPAEFVAAGNFETAMQLLNTTIGVVNFKPLREHFLQTLLSCHTSHVGIPELPSMLTPIHYVVGATRKEGRPYVPNRFPLLVENLNEGYRLTTKGDFSAALATFKTTIHSLPLLIVDSKAEENEVLKMLADCREYILGLQMEMERQSIAEDPSQAARACELTAYFTNCNLQPGHSLLTLRVAATRFYRLKNYKSAFSFAKRMLEFGPPPEQAQQARKIMAACQKNLVDDIPVNYNEFNPFTICASTFTPIYKGSPSIACPYCSATYLPECEGQNCNICELSSVGKKCSGLCILSQDHMF
ncbi:coatomer subunit alpha-like [Zophobas morio]|jgi:coatomer protein complex subunit alpha (xenin)|uniref:coatomer subunit alpha-like n=1 Tax=Zophobas morio TaxID=2755281 RepID=UPI0030831333